MPITSMNAFKRRQYPGEVIPRSRTCTCPRFWPNEVCSLMPAASGVGFGAYAPELDKRPHLKRPTKATVSTTQR